MTTEAGRVEAAANELHGGTIRVESEVGVGSRFTFSLPLKSQAKVATV